MKKPKIKHLIPTSEKMGGDVVEKVENEVITACA